MTIVMNIKELLKISGGRLLYSRTPYVLELLERSLWGVVVVS
jgi:hypothetical protein